MSPSRSDADNRILSQIVNVARQHLIEWIDANGGNTSITSTPFQKYFFPLLDQPWEQVGDFNLLEELICACGGICVACDAPPLRGTSLVQLRNSLGTLILQLK